MVDLMTAEDDNKIEHLDALGSLFMCYLEVDDLDVNGTTEDHQAVVDLTHGRF
jgi:hypothetical protein